MDAFEKWKPVNGYGESSLDAIAEQAFRAGMAEGIKEGLRMAADIAYGLAIRSDKVSTATTVRAAILKEAGE